MISANLGNFSLANKRAFVTDASGGIDSSVCEGYIRSGATLVEPDLEVSPSLQTLLDNYPDQIKFKPTDLTSDSGSGQCSEEIKNLAPEILFNNAAIFDMGSILETNLNQYNRIFVVTVRAMYKIMQETAQSLISKGISGSIINLASQVGHRGEALVTHYCASKAAVISYTQSAGLELADKGVRVNAISLGVVDIPMWEKVDAFFAQFENREIGEKKRLVAEQVPMCRMEKPTGVAKVALFLASELSNYITCQTINVDSGTVMS